MQISKPSILDVFSRIRNEKDASKPDLCVLLWKHLSSTAESSEVDKNGVSMEIRYCLKRLIQGLGSPRAPIRKCYFASLVSILNSRDSTITLDYFKELVDAQLSKYESKGEEGEVLSGRILAYGVAMRSRIFMNGSSDVQRAIITEMVKKSTERSYLPLLTYTFITEFIKTIDKDVFETSVWPVVSSEIMVEWSSQSFETLYCLLEIHELHPTTIKKQQILTALGTPSILHEKTIENVQKMLMNITWEPCLKHPVYEIIGRCLCKHDNGLPEKFWSFVEEALSKSPTRLKILAAFTIFGSIVKHAKLEKIPDLLTFSLIENMFNTGRPSVSKTDQLSTVGKSTLQFIITRITDEEGVNSATVFKILDKLTFESRRLLIDKLTGVRVVFPCVSKLDEKEVKLLAERCKSVIFFNSTRAKEKDSVQHVWNYKDRCYATQLFARLISHPRSKDKSWKNECLKLMLQRALFVSKSEDGSLISGELATTMKNSFFTALSHQSSNIENHRNVLAPLVSHIDEIVTTGVHELRTKLPNDILIQWNDTVSKIKKIEKKVNKSKEENTIVHIFYTLFLQMALHLLVDPAVAKNVLLELDRCYKKEKAITNRRHADDNDSAEPNWVEMTVELFLSLLSHDTYLLRQLIARMFPHLCQHLTAQATFQILQVLDTTSNETILTEDDGDSDSVNGLRDDDEVEEETNVDSSSDSEIEDIDDVVEETAVERTRQAVRDALGTAGSVTDTESIDLDDIDEEEGRKLDAALAQAFKNIQKSQSNKNKKQSPSDKALTHFRIRVLDLVDIYLDNDPSLGLVLDTIPVLFKLLEFTLKDSHQKPLENRTRSTIKKICHLKKCNNVADVDENLLLDSLKSLIDKGVRSTPLFLGLCNEMSECCIFLIRMEVQRTNNEYSDGRSLFYDILVTSLENFFLKRDCLLPISLFENILSRTNWIFNLKLCQRIVELCFSATVRGYRRNQGLSLLTRFYRNIKSSSTLESSNARTELGTLERKILANAVKVLTQNAGVDETPKPTFVSQLFSLLYTIKSNKLCVGSDEWTELSDIVRSSRSGGASFSSISRKYAVKLASALRIDLNIERDEKSTERTLTGMSEENCGTYNGVKVVTGKTNSIDAGAGAGAGVGAHNDKKRRRTSAEEIDDDGEASVVLSAKNIVRRRKSKRKGETRERKNAKRLRSEIANDVEVLKFSEIGLSESL